MPSNHLSHIVCLLDLLCDDACATPNGFLDLVREPIRQGTGLDMGHAPGSKKAHGLLAGFDLQRFRDLAAQNTSSGGSHWASTYHAMPAAAVDYLFSYVPDGSLVLSSESPAWLRQACRDRRLDFFDVRCSPLRFGQDLHIAMDVSSPGMRSRLAVFRISDEELRLEAALLGANLRAHRSRLEAKKQYRFDLDGCLVFVGQHPTDAALIGRDCRFLRCADFSDRLRVLAQGRRVLHMAAFEDSFEFKWAERERQALSDLLGTPVPPCLQNAYQVLSAPDDVVLASISAPMLQEALWFDKTTHWLGEPLVPLAEAHGADGVPEQGYLLVRFQDMIAPAFWHAVLAPEAVAPKLARLPSLNRHYAREILDIWGEHEKVLTWNRPLASGVFERSGGGILNQRVLSLEKAHAAGLPSAPADKNRGEDGSVARIQRLKNSKLGQTAYILGNAPSLNELDVRGLMARESFWCNAAFKLENQGVSFCPKYYLLSDWWAFQTWRDEILNIQAGMKIVPQAVWHEMAKIYPEEMERQNVIAYALKNEADDPVGSYMFSNRGNFSYDPSTGVHGGGSAVLIAIQFAFYMGYSRVLVGGVDLDYSGEQVHFHDGQFGGADAGIMRERVERIQRSFVTAKWHYEKHGRILAKITLAPNLPLDFIGEH